MRVLGIELINTGAKHFTEDIKDLEVLINDLIIIEHESSFEYARVLMIKEENPKRLPKTLKKVLRKAEKRDLDQLKDYKSKTKQAVIDCKDFVKRNKLNMNVLDGFFDFNGSKLTINFTSSERVDFRRLAKHLGGLYKTRIELRQIGTRDKAKMVGGLGPCGRPICCNLFLKNFDSISINIKKNQGIALNPTKINGQCGRLLCCLNYEDDLYSELKRKFPRVGKEINTKFGRGKVLNINIFKGTYLVGLPENRIEEIELKRD
jgi:cell fate regulator YaaT (PSP1 superfamily)